MCCQSHMDKYDKAEKRVPNWVEYVETGKDQFKEDNIGRLNKDLAHKLNYDLPKNYFTSYLNSDEQKQLISQNYMLINYLKHIKMANIFM